MKNKQRTEFSKKLLIQESILIWLITAAALVLAYICIINSYFGELPWLSVIVGLPWSAYGVSQGFYYNKAKAENLEKINNNKEPNIEFNFESTK